MPFVTVPDGTHLYDEERGAGEPLLLISGNGRDHPDWNGVRDDFSDRYHVISQNKQKVLLEEKE